MRQNVKDSDDGPGPSNICRFDTSQDIEEEECSGFSLGEDEMDGLFEVTKLVA